MAYPDDIIRQSIEEFKLEKAMYRRRKIEKLLNYYTNTSTWQYIEDYFDSKSFQEVPIYNINLTRKFIDKKSRVYTLPPTRKINGEENKKYNSLTKYKNVRFKHIERMTNLLGNPAVRVAYEDKGDEFCFEYYTVNAYDAVFGDNPYQPIGIFYPILMPTEDVSYEKPCNFAYWDDSVYMVVNEKGEIVEEHPNPYGVLPFIFPRDIPQIDDFYAEGATDVISVNEHCNILMTELMLGLRFQMFGQPFATGVYDDKPIERMGSDTIINLPEGGTFGIETPGGDPKKVMEILQFKIEMLALSRHMNVSFESSQDRPSSGLALRIKDFEHIEDSKDDLENWRMLEQDLFKVERKIAFSNGINLAPNFAIDFTEPEYPRGVNEQIAKDNWDLEKGLVTLEQIMVRDRTDMTEEMAKKIIDKNLGNSQEEPSIDSNEEII